MAKELWCVHVRGPDTLIAQPDLETAERRAEAWNATIARRTETHPFDPYVEAIVELWPYTAEGHARQLVEHGGDPGDIC